MTPRVIRVSEPREILAAINFQLGFLPEESLVAIGLRGPRSALGLLARVDLADLASTEEGSFVADSVAGHLRDDGAREVIAVVYTDGVSDLRAGRGAARRALDVLREALGDLGGPDFWVGGGRYGALGCDDVACCPPDGHPLTDLESTQVGASMVLAGATVAPNRAGLAHRERAGEAARRSAARALAGERRRLASLPLDAAYSRARSQWAAACSAVRAGRGLDPAALGRCGAALEVPALRDDLLGRFAIGPALGSGPLTADEAAAALFRGGSRPAYARLEPFRTTLRAVVAHLPIRRGAPALALLALMSWWTGDNARAEVLATQCLEVDRGNRLAHQTRELLAAGLPPAWWQAQPRAERVRPGW